MHLPYGLALLGMLAAAVSYWVAVFVPRLAQYLSPVYAVGEGMMLGLFSAYAETRFPGVVMIALVATLCELRCDVLRLRDRVHPGYREA